MINKSDFNKQIIKQKNSEFVNGTKYLSYTRKSY